jgi:RNA recognition motif-containing protein
MLIGNLPLDASEKELSDFFSTVGKVSEVKILKDKEGRGRGFAFVTMADQKLNKEALVALDNSEFKGRIISVSLAKKAPPQKVNGFFANLFRTV